MFCYAFRSSALSAFAEEWTKTYQVGDKPTLRVDTNDASVEITRGASHTVSARVITEGFNIGGSGVRVTERQDGDKVDLQVHVPESVVGHPHQHARGSAHRSAGAHGNRARLALRRRAHRGRWHLRRRPRIDTGDGHIQVRNFTGGLHAHTGDGHMTIDGVLTDVDLRTGDGHIDLTVRPGSKMSNGWLIHTSDGRVEARLPQDFAAELYAHTGDGRIQLDMPVTVNGSIERSRIRGKLNGGGPLLEITTGDGSIRIGKF